MNVRACLILAVGAVAAASVQAQMYPTTLLDNTTGAADALFLGPPDDDFLGLGSAQVTYDFGASLVVNRPGLVDINVYEVDWGSPEFDHMDILVSSDGVVFTSVKASEQALVGMAGDAAHGSSSYGRSYDLGAFATVRYVRIDGLGTSPPGSTSGFDLDAIGAHEVVAVPEPAAGALLLAGLLTLGAWARRRP